MPLRSILVLVLIFAACGGGGSDEPLGLQLEGDGARVTVTLTNLSDETVRVVRPTQTPNFVLIQLRDSGGDLLPFIGEHRRLRPLDEAGFAELAPGDSTSSTFDMTELFSLTAGTFTVDAEYRNPESGSHEGTSALTFEPGEGIPAETIAIVVP